MAYALIEPGGRVAQIESTIFPVAEPLQWIECADTVTTEHRFDGQAFIAPIPQVPVPEGETVSDRVAKLEAALVKKGVVTREDVDAEVVERGLSR